MDMSTLLNQISDNVPHAASEYVGKNGLLHCSVCHKPVQTKVEFMGIEKTVRCICDCRKKEMDAWDDRQQQEANQRKRQICFADTNMASWNFEKDDQKNPKLTAAMKNYVKQFTEFKAEGKGLLLYGTCGTGKTFFAACIANALLDEGYTVQMTNFARLTNQLQGTFEKQEIIDELNRKSLVIIDDLGAERKSEYMQEQVFNIIDARYRSGLPLIITTNLTADEIKKPQEIGYARIYDRILEKCIPVAVEGTSRRRQSVREHLAEDKKKLGLL